MSINYDSIISQLQKNKTLRCLEVVKMLEYLGFQVNEGKASNHKIFTHNQLPGFIAGGFNCEHGKNGEVKRPYLRKILRVLQKYEADLKTFSNPGG